MNIDQNKPVMVSGATGYVAGWLVKKLLQEGRTVHAAVRSPENKDKVRHLDEMAASLPGEIKYFKVDLLTEGSYDAAMAGCELVYHTASPFFLGSKNPQKDLIEPALKGTRNILTSANKSDSVKRVVVTSSCAAIYGDASDLANTPKGVFTEEEWNTTSNLKHHAYSYSKTLAEREAWKIAKAQDKWDLVTVNPSFVLGPGTNPKAQPTSFQVVKQMGDGTMKMGGPAMYLGANDVRDLANAHYLAGNTPEAKGRYIISAENTGMLELAGHLRNHFGNQYPFPKRHLPKWLLWLAAPAVGMTRKEVKLTIGFPWKADNSKSIRELGMEYRPVSETIVEMFQQMVDAGVMKKR